MKKYEFKKALVCFTASSVIMSNVLWVPKVNALGIFDLNSNVITEAVNQYNLDIAPGVHQKHYTFIDKSGKMTEAFIVDVDMHSSTVSIEAGTPDDNDTYKTQTVRKQAESSTYGNHLVVAATNGDYYNMANGVPFGVVIKDGRTIKDDQFSTWRFFGITKDNKAVIGDRNYYYSIKKNLKEALGGQAIIVKDGKPFEKPEFNAARNPRTAVGIKADGNVFFITVDGRQDPYSSGISYDDLASLMIDYGAVSAIDLDGGGSATCLSRRPGEDILELVNSPSDGNERSVANSWLVVSTAVPDHTFDNAFVEPYDETFTPGSTIQFTARGRDKSLSYAPVPVSGLEWELSDKSFGSIDSNGKFISSGKTGELQVMLKYNGKTAGSSTIEIQNPDEINFAYPKLIVGKGTVKPIAITGKYKKRNVKINPSNIKWQIQNNLGTIDDKGMLHVAESPSSGNITATYKNSGLSANLNVTVGQLPETIFDFESGLWSWKASTAGRGETGTVELASSQTEPVRYGSNSLKINFDFTNGQKSSTLGVYAGPGEKLQLSGYPTSIGMWVYATPEAKGYWLRAAVEDSSGNIHNLNLTSGAVGIDWTGWKYVEADLPSGVSGPFIINPEQMIRIMSTDSGTTGPMTKGSIYVDNIRAIYGFEQDDLRSPVIGNINVDGKTYDTPLVNIIANVYDYDKDGNMSGINWNKVKISVDNIDYTDRKGNFSYDRDGYVSLSGIKWSNGKHDILISAEDNNGNTVQKSASFTVQ